MILNILRGIRGAVTAAASKFVAAVLNTEQLYTKNSLMVMAAAIMADGNADDSEIEAAANIIAADPQIQDQNGKPMKNGELFDAMTVLAEEIASFEKICKVVGGMSGPVGRNLMKGKIEQFRNEVPKEEDREMILAQAAAMIGADGIIKPEEEKVLNLFRQAVC